MKTPTSFPCGLRPVRCPDDREAMTLIELLVVISILVLLMAIAVPQLKPALESQQSRSVAQNLGVMLQRARLQSLEQGQLLGVRFERYLEYADDTTGTGSGSDACVTFRVVKPNLTNSGSLLKENEGVYIIAGRVHFYEYEPYPNTTDRYHWVWKGIDDARFENITGMVQVGGRLCQYKKSYDAAGNLELTLLDAYNNNINYPVEGLDNAPTAIVDPDTFTGTLGGGIVALGDSFTNTAGNPSNYVSPQPFFIYSTIVAQPSLATPTVLPSGCIIDLRWSGTSDPRAYTSGSSRSICDQTNCFWDNGKDITLMFSPEGSVERIFIGNDMSNCIFPTEPIHFLIGDWDQLRSHAGVKEDPRNNYELSRNYWVSIDPRNGTVVTNEVYPVVPVDRNNPTLDEIRDSRRFADEINLNYGGF